MENGIVEGTMSVRQAEQADLVAAAEQRPGVKEIAEVAAAIGPVECRQPNISHVVTVPAISTNQA